MLSDPTTSAAPLGEGTTLAGRYRLGGRLARGGMADVYEAHDAQLDRPVAVKVFRAAEPADRGRFEAEAHLLASLNHPNLVAVYDAGEHHEAPYMVLELVKGPTLRTRIAEHGPQPAAEVAGLGADLAGALAHIHTRGVVHRDLTPANVLCGPGGTPKLTDFGIARVIDTTRVTAEHLTVGTAGYMSPEQVSGEEVTAATDVYSLGLVLLEALTGAPAFSGPSHEVAVARLSRDPVVPEGLPEPWPALLRSMTARVPSDRPEAAAVAAALAHESTSPAIGGAALGTPGRDQAGTPVVVPTDPAAEPDVATTAMPVAETGPPPSGTSPANETAVMPVALVPVPEPPADEGDPASGTDPTGTERPAPHEALVAAPVAAAGALRRGARRLRGRHWMVLAAGMVFVLAAWQSGRGSWSEQVDAARAAAAASATPTTTTAPTTTTTTPPPTDPVVVAPADDDGPEEGRGKGKEKGKGKGKADKDDDDD